MQRNKIRSRTSKIPADKIFKIAATVAGVYVLLVIALLVVELSIESQEVFLFEGIDFLFG